MAKAAYSGIPCRIPVKRLPISYVSPNEQVDLLSKDMTRKKRVRFDERGSRVVQDTHVSCFTHITSWIKKQISLTNLHFFYKRNPI